MASWQVQVVHLNSLYGNWALTRPFPGNRFVKIPPEVEIDMPTSRDSSDETVWGMHK